MVLAQADDSLKPQWLRDPVFDGVAVIDVFHKDKGPKPELFGPQNVHTYFRKEVFLDSKPREAILHITGDDYYKLYANGAFVVQGPEPGYPFAHPFYSLDVAPHLVAGVNCLAAHAFYQGLLNRVWNSADNRSGFMLRLDVTYEDGSKDSFITDDTWRCHTSTTYPSDRTIGYQTQFAEDIDLREEPIGWKRTGFDDTSWAKPLVGFQDHVFVQQTTPPLEHIRKEPVSVVDKGNGNYFYDFGTEIVGHARIRVKGPAGHKLEVRHGEELTAPETVRYEMRAKCLYQEFPILSGGDDTIEFYDYRAFRYIELLNCPAPPKVWVDVRHHPFDVAAARFEASNDLLERTWEICRNGVRFASQGGFLDCPSREKGAYLGDALITSQSHLILTADASLTRKSIEDFQLSQRICPGIMAVAPGSFMQEIAEYSLQWPIILREYYLATGDRAFLEKMVDAAFEGLYGYFARFESETGLLTGVTEKWVLVDWPDNLRDDYDYEYAATRENTVLNAFYYASLQTASELLRELGRDASAYEAKAERVKAAFDAQLLNPATGLFLDAPGSAHSSLHANAIPLRYGLVREENVPKVIELIRQKRLSCGVYIAPFVIEACYEAGFSDLGYDLLTSKDEHSWHEMLRHGATTCMEAWGPDQKWNTSWCHPWSSSPIYLTAQRVMGLRPAEPGWKRIRFEPRVPAQLAHAAITIPIPGGRVTARYAQETGFVVTAPPDVPVDAETGGVPVIVRHSISHGEGTLSPEQAALLERYGWTTRLGASTGVWVSISEQMVRVIRDGELVWQAPCSTAANGPGSEKDSFKTPLGWHSVAERLGDGAPWGAVFKSKKPTGKAWKPGEETEEDLVLTRILALAGEEPGKNKGGNVDSYARNIYFHGTNAEEKIGTPVSHGCIRLTNDDVILAFERVPLNAPVLITE